MAAGRRGAEMAEESGAARVGREATPSTRAVAGTLYVVATPLGNLRDVTLRALDILGTADLIAAEDTRVTAVLLRHYGIGTRAVSLHAHNEAQRVATICAALAEGRSVALVSDAGTPAISDPGARLVRDVRAAGHRVEPIPGACAAIAAVCAAGLMAESFLFAGFLPVQAKSRRERLTALAQLPAALVFYEAPHRVAATVDALEEALGPDRVLVVAREVTKTFETVASMPLAQASQWFAADANRTRGELVLIVDIGTSDAAKPALTLEAERWLIALLAELPPARAARVVAAMTGAARDAVYARALALKPST